MKELTDIIEVTITEEARLTAERFSDRCNCLLATQLKLDGYDVIEESMFRTLIQGTNYWHEPFFSKEAKADHSAIKKPYYVPEVVGTRIILTREH